MKRLRSASLTADSIVATTLDGEEIALSPGSYLKRSTRTGQSYWTLRPNRFHAYPRLTYTNKRGETRKATPHEVLDLIGKGYITPVA